jgi:hypothetical protein
MQLLAGPTSLKCLQAWDERRRFGGDLTPTPTKFGVYMFLLYVFI